MVVTWRTKRGRTLASLSKVRLPADSRSYAVIAAGGYRDSALGPRSVSIRRPGCCETVMMSGEARGAGAGRSIAHPWYVL